MPNSKLAAYWRGTRQPIPLSRYSEMLALKLETKKLFKSIHICIFFFRVWSDAHYSRYVTSSLAQVENLFGLWDSNHWIESVTTAPYAFWCPTACKAVSERTNGWLADSDGVDDQRSLTNENLYYNRNWVNYNDWDLKQQTDIGSLVAYYRWLVIYPQVSTCKLQYKCWIDNRKN